MAIVNDDLILTPISQERLEKYNRLLEVEAATADELIAKVRELVPLEPEQEEQIRQMHAARAAQMAKKH